jgi:hypothetical protein
LLNERANKLKELHNRVEEVQTKREEIMLLKRAKLEVIMEKGPKAEKARQMNLDEIVRRAKEDEHKVSFPFCGLKMTKKPVNFS